MTPDKDAEIARLRAEYDKRLEEYAAENAALRDRIKGEHMSYLAECKYKEEIADLAKKLGAEVAANGELRELLRYARGNLKPEAIWCAAAIDKAIGK